MRYILIFTFSFLTNHSYSQIGSSAKKIKCDFSIVKLTFEGNLNVGKSNSSIKLLSLAIPTCDTLIRASHISDVVVMTDTSCCTYIGNTYATSLVLFLTTGGDSVLNISRVFESTGTPVALVTNGREVLRAYIVNGDTTFSTKNIAIRRGSRELSFINQYPQSADWINWELIHRIKSWKCLPKTMYN
jgi:hypothetical protein